VADRPGAMIPMRLSPAQAQQVFEYNFRVFDRFVRKVRRLSWRAANRKREIGHQSLFRTLVHILNVHEAWIAFVIQLPDAELDKHFSDPARHPKDWKGFNAYHRRVRNAIDAYLLRLTPAELARPVKAWWMPGEYTVSDALLQTTFEQAHHLGEVIGALWQDDIPSPAMTWIQVVRNRPRRGAGAS
jgi:uncharacterized damage-inducible protein DinB